MFSLPRDVDKVHDLMDNVNEQQEIANEIAAAISMPTGTDLVDDDDLLRELEELTVRPLFTKSECIDALM